MKPQMRFFWMIALMFFTTGCSGYRVVGNSLPEVSREEPRDSEDAAIIEPGNHVRLTLVDGTQVQGTVELISSHEIVLDPQGQSEQPRGYSADQIQSIEQKPIDGPSTTTTVLVIGGMALIAGGAILAKAMSELNELNHMWEQ